jgi:hypothetical protein
VVIDTGHWCTAGQDFTELARRLTMPFPPCIGLVIHQGGEDESRSELVAGMCWLKGEGHYLCRLADDCALNLGDELGTWLPQNKPLARPA